MIDAATRERAEARPDAAAEAAAAMHRHERLAAAVDGLANAGVDLVKGPLLRIRRRVMASLVAMVLIPILAGAAAGTGTIMLAIGAVGAVQQLVGQRWIALLLIGGALLVASIGTWLVLRARGRRQRAR